MSSTASVSVRECGLVDGLRCFNAWKSSTYCENLFPHSFETAEALTLWRNANRHRQWAETTMVHFSYTPPNTQTSRGFKPGAFLRDADFSQPWRKV